MSNKLPAPRPLVASVVDYAAWEKGYMPPCEHILIHELSYEGAKVEASCRSSKQAWWLVIKGEHDIEDLVDISEAISLALRVKKRQAEKRASQPGQ